ncbi:MAG: hypothetical protein QOF62_148 [Pyrinomonadaceae bacterium]|nr:hypothetical protein [Pyrinomonadaceae bacterium]
MPLSPQTESNPRMRLRVAMSVTNLSYGQYLKAGGLALFLTCIWFGSSSGRQEPPNAIPIVRFDKTRFALGEDIFFWEGVEQTSRAPIPKQYQSSCRRSITLPDGTQKTENVGWPMDGPPNSGWLGGADLSKEIVKLGRYAIVFEFAGQKTAPAFFFVEDAPILEQIKTEFVFPKLVGDPAVLHIHLPTTEKVTLIVNNNSSQTLRFPRLGGNGPLVSVSIKRIDGSYANDFFYPDNELSGKNQGGIGSIGFDTFTWEIAKKVPTITVRAGETYRQELSLQAAFDEGQKSLSFSPGEYRVTFSTELPILIGEKNGPWADLSPVRLPANTTAMCVLTR